MKQMICGGFTGASTSAVNSSTLQGGADWQIAGNEVYVYEVAASPGVLSNLQFKIDVAPGTGKSWAFTLYQNGVASALTTTISNAATSNADTTHSVTIAANDYLYVSVTPTGTPAAFNTARWSCLFTSTNSKESLIMGTNQPYTAGTIYSSLMNAGQSNTTNELETYGVIPTGGTIKNLYVQQSGPSGAGSSYIYTLRKNGASSTLTTTLANVSSNSDTIHSVSVVAGDYVDLEIDETGSPGGVVCSWGVTFVATTDGESILLGQTIGYSLTSTNYYCYLSTYEDVTASTTENTLYGGQSGPVLKKLYAYLNGAAGGNIVFTLRANNASTSLAATVTAGNTTGNDTSDTYTVGDYGTLDILFYANTGTLPMSVSWGLVCYYAPAVSGGAIYAIPLGFVHGY